MVSFFTSLLSWFTGYVYVIYGCTVLLLTQHPQAILFEDRGDYNSGAPGSTYPVAWVPSTTSQFGPLLGLWEDLICERYRLRSSRFPTARSERLRKRC